MADRRTLRAVSRKEAEPSHARERRWPAGHGLNIYSRRPVMRVVIRLSLWQVLH